MNSLADRVGNRLGSGAAYFLLSYAARRRHDHDAAVTAAEHALAIFRETSGRSWLPWALQRLGLELDGRGDYDDAEPLFREALQLFRETGNVSGEAMALSNLAHVLRRQGDIAQAAKLFHESLALTVALDNRWLIAETLVALADIAHALGRPHRAARLLGAAEALNESIGVTLYAWASDMLPVLVDDTRSVLGEEVFVSAWQEGRSWPMERAIEEALAVTSLESDSSPAKVDDLGLTQREVEVLRLLPQGLTNAQIAETLFVSPRTVQTHLTNLYGKLGVEGRAEAIAVAVRHETS
jgi:ATP/maltotriose-dependent transcriptional regulator MalT